MKQYLIPSILVLIVLCLPGCKGVPERVILTVNGPVPVEDMGITLVHEHVLVDFIGADSTGYHRWDKEAAAQRIIPFLVEIRNMDVQTVFECTPAYLGRDPLLLQSLSRKTGMPSLLIFLKYSKLNL